MKNVLFLFTGALAVIAFSLAQTAPAGSAKTGAAQKTGAKTGTAKTGAAKAGAKTGVSRAALLNPARLIAKAPEVYRTKFTTTKGDFVVEVHRAWSPLGADRFYNLVRNGFFNDASFFRAISGFMVQFGIHAEPKISAAWREANIKDDPVTQSNKRGFVSFATGGPNTRTTQVFVNLVDNVRLDSMGFSPFGQVVEGMDIVDQLYTGYGEGAPSGAGPDQGRIQAEGKVYLDKEFPRLDSVKTAIVLPAAGAAAPASTPGSGAKAAPRPGTAKKAAPAAAPKQ